MFTNPEYVAALPQMETESSELEVTPNKFIGEYCEKCVKRYNRCWCDKSDWDEELMEVELLKAPTKNQDNTTNITKWPNNLVSVRPLQDGQNLEMVL